MARYVNVGILAPDAPQPEVKPSPREAVDLIIKHWQLHAGRVLPDRPDLILTPEASARFAYGGIESDPWTSEYEAAVAGPLLEFWQALAKKHSCYVAFSAYRTDQEGKRWNSTRIIDRQGKTAGIYNKNHLVIEENSRMGVSYGTEAPLIRCDFGTVGCAICFDLNYDELRLQYAKARPDLVLFSSVYHGGLMQNYWAYSCRAHFVSAVAGRPSKVISPVGEDIATTTNYFHYVTARVNLDCCVMHLDYNWDKLHLLKEKYGAKVRVFDPGHLAPVLVSSETDEFTIDRIVKEFGFELLDDYFNRARAHRAANL